MQVLSKSMEDFLFGVAGRIVPEVDALDPLGRWRFIEIINDTLASKPKSIHTQFVLFLQVLRYSTVPVFFHPLDRLSAQRQDAVMREFQDSRIGLLRQGFWALKTLVCMGYYGQIGVRTRICYNPVPDGNERLHD